MEPKIEPDALPCPFCGESAYIQPWHGGGPLKRSLGCENEDCLVQPNVTASTRSRALSGWNTRTEEPIPHNVHDDGDDE